MNNRCLKIILFLTAISLLSCKKGPGQGGTSSIRGKLYEINFNSNFSARIDSGYIGKEDIYIIYGNDATYSDNQKTNYDGTYEFKYLRKGNYRVFAYSKDSSSSTPL